MASEAIADSIARLRLNLSGQLAFRGNFPYQLAPRPIVRRSIASNHNTVRQRRVLFVISSGRTGTGFLARLLNSAEDVLAEHEARPKMTGHYLRLVESNPLSDSFVRRQVKVLGVNRRLMCLPESYTYAETNHMFIKTFFDVVLCYYDNVEVIRLRRDLPATLKSFVELGYFSTKTHHWPLWMHRPDSKNCAIQPPLSYSDMDSIDRCIAYILDIEARSQAFAIDNQTVPIHDVWLEDISTPGGARKLFSSLGITWTDESNAVCQEIANAAHTTKKLVQNRVTIDECRIRLTRYIQLANDRNYSLPAVPQRIS